QPKSDRGRDQSLVGAVRWGRVLLDSIELPRQFVHASNKTLNCPGAAGGGAAADFRKTLAPPRPGPGPARHPIRHWHRPSVLPIRLTIPVRHYVRCAAHAAAVFAAPQ